MPEFILYLLLIAAFIFSIFTSINVKSTIRKYNKMPSSRGMSAATIARQILDSNGLYNVQITRVSGELTDHYNPRTNTVALSAPVYDSISVGAIGVAAHEVGHAIQYAENYTPIKIRMAILPVAQFGSSAWILFFILGIVFNMPLLRGVGIGLFAAIVLFHGGKPCIQGFVYQRWRGISSDLPRNVRTEGNAAEDFRYTDPDHGREGRGMKRFFYAKIALTNLNKNRQTYFP